jgi:hypothetical protein
VPDQRLLSQNLNVLHLCLAAKSDVELVSSLERGPIMVDERERKGNMEMPMISLSRPVALRTIGLNRVPGRRVVLKAGLFL